MAKGILSWPLLWAGVWLATPLVNAGCGDDDESSSTDSAVDGGGNNDAEMDAQSDASPDAVVDGDVDAMETPDAMMDAVVDATPDAMLPTGALRVVHLLPDEGPVSVFVDGEAMALASGLAREGGTAELSVAAGTRALSVRRDGEAADFFSTMVTIGEGERKSVAFYDEPPQRLVSDDNLARIPAGMVRVNLVHVAPGLGEVDLIVGGTPLASDLAIAASAEVEIMPTALSLGVDTDDDAVIDVLFSLPSLTADALETVYVAQDSAGAPFLLAHRPDGTTLRIDPEAQCAMASHSGMVPLASTMMGSSRVTEFNLTGSIAQVDRGDGTMGDADGLYDVTNPMRLLGSPVDFFPRETAFVVGSATYDAASVTGCGVETVPVTGIDLGEFWTNAMNNDISDAGLSLWFGGDDAITLVFGTVDVADTLTFTGGVLTSIDITVTLGVTLSVNFGAPFTGTYNGSLVFAGGTFTAMLDDTLLAVPTFFGPVDSRMLWNLGGTIDVIP
ncbi:MAG: DUF4397 domain-containing protein [Myxococcota bacterium]